MVDTRKILAQLFLVCAVFLIIGFETSTVRGARFRGGRSGGSSSRSSSSRSSRYRSSSYGYSSRSSSYRSSSYRSGTRWKVALASSLYYGSRRYKTRSRYRSNSEPQICENNNNFQDGDKTQKWGKFVCPLGEQPDDYAYCCGDKGNQTCCQFFDDGARTFGVVIGILILFGIIGLIIFCICHSQKEKNKPMRMEKTAKPSKAHFDSNRVAMEPGYPAMPPSYEKANDLPYSPNPTGYQAPYQQPYPMAPGPPSPYNPQNPAEARAPPYSPAPIGFTAAYNDPNMPGQGYTAPNAVPPPYPN